MSGAAAFSSCARPLNILCCSTRQWNAGDEWILLGIRRLFRLAFPHVPFNWILYDRSPDCFTSPWESPERRSGLLANSFQPERALHGIDLIVAGGTPEWIGPHFESLMMLPDAASKPWFFLGIDHIHPEFSPTAQEVQILSRAFITARGRLAFDALKTIGLVVPILPCPSLFASPWEHPVRAINSVGVVIQNDCILNQCVSTELKRQTLTLVQDLAARFQTRIICNYIDEFMELLRLPTDVAIHYSYDSADYFKLVAQCDLIVTTRLHSALLANSLVKPAIVVNRDPRVLSAIDPCPYIFAADPKDVLKQLNVMDAGTIGRNLFNWKRNIEQHYIALIMERLQRHGLYQLSDTK